MHVPNDASYIKYHKEVSKHPYEYLYYYRLKSHKYILLELYTNLHYTY